MVMELNLGRIRSLEEINKDLGIKSPVRPESAPAEDTIGATLLDMGSPVAKIAGINQLRKGADKKAVFDALQNELEIRQQQTQEAKTKQELRAKQLKEVQEAYKQTLPFVAQEIGSAAQKQKAGQQINLTELGSKLKTTLTKAIPGGVADVTFRNGDVTQPNFHLGNGETIQPETLSSLLAELSSQGDVAAQRAAMIADNVLNLSQQELQAQQLENVARRRGASGEQVSEAGRIGAGLSRPVSREEVGEPGAFGDTDAATQRAAVEMQVAQDTVSDLILRLEEMPEDAFGGAGSFVRFIRGVENAASVAAKSLGADDEIIRQLGQDALEISGFDATPEDRAILSSLYGSLLYNTAKIVQGQQGRDLSDKDVALARAIVGDPESIFADKRTAVTTMRSTMRTIEGIVSARNRAAGIDPQQRMQREQPAQQQPTFIYNPQTGEFE